MKSANKGCINEENRTGGHSFTSGVSPKNNNMLGEQITTGQLTNLERSQVLTLQALRQDKQTAIQHASITNSPP